MSSLAEGEKALLIQIARRALVAAVERQSMVLTESPADSVLNQPSGAFVTLHKAGRLRGCIGQLPGREPLVEVVAHCAASAALEDPRFSPVRPEEVAGIEIEISILSPLRGISVEEIEPGKHGLVVSRGWNRGVLLPQVAAQFRWDAERFLEETCEKAGLDRMAWRDSQTLIQAFTADVFSERDIRSQ